MAVTGKPLRTFVALELPDGVRAAIGRTIERLNSELGERNRCLRWVDASAAHLTLKFLGATPETAVAGVEAAMREAVGAWAKGELSLATSHVGFFPGPRVPNVIWLGLDGDVERLGALRDALEGTIAPLGWPTEKRPFQPHLTLARFRKEATPAERAGVARVLGQLWAPEPVPFRLCEVSLMQSVLGPAGAQYSRLVAVPLG